MYKNNDGVLSADEFKAKSCKMGEKECKHHKGMHERMDNAFKTLDKNGDGKISEEEFTNSGEEKRVKMDKNGDGKITEAEFGSARSMSAKKHCGCGK
jgi:Ca2+-binding EF-hand superfamily protein